MQSKDDKNSSFLTLPKEIVKDKIGDKLAISNLSRLARTCTQVYGFFDNQLKSYHLLKCIVDSELDSAKDIIIKNPKLLLMRGDIIDYSARIFKNITPFLLALWYKDRRMIRLIKKYLDPQEAVTNFMSIFSQKPNIKKTTATVILYWI